MFIRLSSCLALLIAFLSPENVRAQFLINYPSMAQSVSTCLTTSTLTVKLDVITTGSGGTLTVDFPPGVYYVPGSIMKVSGTIASINEVSNAPGQNTPSFTLSSANSGEFIEFTLQREAPECEARTFVLGGGIMKDVITATSSAGSVTEDAPNVNSYNLLFPSLALTPPAPTANAQRNVPYTRTGTVTNGGTGCADNVRFYIIYLMGKVDNIGDKVNINGTDFPVASTNGDTLFFDISGATMFGGDGLLCNGESFTYEVQERVLDCSMGAATLTPEYGAGWGCPGTTRCQTATGTSPFNMATGVAIPGITFTTLTEQGGCIMGNYNVIFANNGNGGNAGAMYNVISDFSMESPFGSFLAGPLRVFKMLNFKIGSTALTSTSPVGFDRVWNVDMSQLNTDPDGPGGLEDLDGDGQFDDLAPGNSYVINLDRMYIPSTNCPRNWAESIWARMTYNTPCLAGQVISQPFNHGPSYFYMAGPASSYIIPPSVSNGQPFSVQLCTQGSLYPPPNGSVDSVYITLQLPPELSLVTGSVTATSSAGTVTPSVQVNGSTVIIGTKGIRSPFCYFFDLVYTCGVGGAFSVPYEWSYVMDRSCGAIERLDCKTMTTLAICPGPCPLLAPSITGTRIERTSLGWTNGTLTTKITPATMTSLSRKTVMSRDTFLFSTGAHIAAPVGGHDDLIFEYQLGRPVANQDAIVFLEGTLRYKPSGSAVVTATCPVSAPSLALSTSNLQVNTFDFTPLLGGCLPATLGNGDSVFLDLKFRVTEAGSSRAALFGSTRLPAPNSVATFFTLNGTTRETCISLVPDVLFLGQTIYVSTFANVNFTGCASNEATLALDTYFYSEPTDAFPNEYRPSLTVDSIVLTIPPGYAYDLSGTARYRYGFWNSLLSNSSAFYNIPASFITVTGNKVVIDNTTRHIPWTDIGGITLNDIFYPIRPTCEAPATGPNTIVTGYQRPFAYANNTVTEAFTLGGLPTYKYTYNAASKPSLSLQNLTGTVQGIAPVQQWTVRISNTSAQTAPYVWFAVEDAPTGAGIDVIEVLDGVTPLTAIPYPGGKWYQVSAAGLMSGATRDLTVRFTYDGCTPQQINALTGWDCPGYPADPTAYSCGTPNTVTPLPVEPLPSEIQLTLDQEPTAPVPACVPFQYVLTINSAQAANVLDVAFGMNLPAGIAITGNFEAEYPKGSGNWETITNSGTATMPRFDLMTHTQMPTDGLPGTSMQPTTPPRQVCLRFNMETSCDFSPGTVLDFRVFGMRPCGGSAIGDGTTVTSNALQIQGVTTPYVVSTIGNIDNPVEACTTPKELEISHTIVGGTTGATDSIFITLPAGINYNGTLTCVTNCPTFESNTLNMDGTRLIKLKMPSGVAAGGVIAYSLGIVGDGFAGCATGANIRIRTVKKVAGPMCGAITCPDVLATTSTVDKAVDIEKPSFTIANFMVTGLVPPSGSTAYSATMEVTNSGTVDLPAGGSVILEFFCRDAMGNPTGAPVGAYLLNGPVAVGAIVPITAMFSDGCNPANGMAVAIQDVTDAATPAPGTPATEQCLCSETAPVNAPIMLCEEIADATGPQVICEGKTLNDFVFATQNSDIDGIQFVYFTGSAAADPYMGGTVISMGTGNGTNVTLAAASLPTAVGDYWIYAILTPTPSDPACRPAGLARLTINANPTATNTSLSNCQSGAGGTAEFNLSDATTDVLGGQTGLTVTYHFSQMDAENDVNPLTNPYIGSNGQIVYARVENPITICFAIAEVTLNATVCLSIGSTVFFDNDNDGIQDPLSENGIAGVTVRLYAPGTDGVIGGGDDVLIDTDDTDSNGDYYFDGLITGDYFIVIPTSNFVAGGDLHNTQSSDPTDTADNQQDNDDNGSPDSSGDYTGAIVSPLINLAADSEPVNDPDPNFPPGETGSGDTQDDADDNNGDMTVDFGFVPLMSLGSNVFADTDNDGLDDGASDPGIPGVLVNVYSTGPDGAIGGGDDVLVGTSTTDPSGNWFVDSLIPGKYYAQIPTPPTATPYSSTNTDTADNQQDNDDNGIQAPLGGPITSPVITLYPDLEPNNEPGPGGDQDDDTVDPTRDDDNGDMTIDFGLVEPVSIGSTVFYDRDNNGTQNGVLETGIIGVTIQLLFDANNDGVIDGAELTPVFTDVTDGNGDYFFSGLPPGNYIVRIPTPDASALVNSTGQDMGDAIDGNDNGLQAGGAGTATESALITLQPNTEPDNTAETFQGSDQDDSPTTETDGNMTIDFGFVPTMSVGSTVFADVNNNGTQNTANPLEDGIAGVSVDLYFDNDNDPLTPLVLALSTTTDANGNYFFGNLPEGNYQVVLPSPPGSAPTSSGGQDTGDATDGNDNGAQTGSGNPISSTVFNLDAGMEPNNTVETFQGGGQDDGPYETNGNMTIDFGLIPEMSIGSSVFNDNNNDGLQNGADTGIPGVLVWLLYDANGDGQIDGPEVVPVATTLTDGSGNYVFDTLPAGRYQIEIPYVANGPLSTTPLSSTGPGASTLDNNVDGNDDGNQPGGSGTPVFSPFIDLTAGNEAVNGGTETAQGNNLDGVPGAPDDDGNMTVDFGFTACALVVQCPANIIVNNEANKCGAVVNYTAPMVMSSCNPYQLLPVAPSLPSGSFFPVGTSIVKWIAQENIGSGMTMCSFTVTVNDEQKPTLTCPTDIVKWTALNQCTAPVFFALKGLSDNCAGAMSTTVTTAPTAGLTSGSNFPLGTTLVTYEAKDAANNTETCSFTVKVSDGQAPSISCPVNQTRNTDANVCTAVVTYAPVVTDNCPNPTWAAVTPSHASGSAFAKGVTTVVLRATDAAGLTKTCTFRVTVNDRQAPSISCDASQSVNTGAGQCSAVVTYNDATFTDNCAPTSGTAVRISGLPSGAAFPKGTTNVVYKATDASGNFALCSVKITVTDNEKPKITCPNGPISRNTDAGKCGAAVSYSTPVSTDNCPGVQQQLLSGLASGSSFPVGSTVVRWQAKDAVGLTETCEFTVTVVDNQLPTITCPPNTTVMGGAAPCTIAKAQLPSATAQDNCGVTSLSSNAPASLPAGATVVTWTAQDAANQQAQCQHTVTVMCQTGPNAGGGGNVLDLTTDGGLGLGLAPNPASESVLVTVAGIGGEGASLSVMDALGRTVWTRTLDMGTEQVVIDLTAQFAEGHYQVSLRTDSAVITKSLVVVKR